MNIRTGGARLNKAVLHAIGCVFETMPLERYSSFLNSRTVILLKSAKFNCGCVLEVTAGEEHFVLDSDCDNKDVRLMAGWALSRMLENENFGRVVTSYGLESTVSVPRTEGTSEHCRIVL